MEIFLYKNHLIENCEKNYKQTCSKQKIANVSSVKEEHKAEVRLFLSVKLHEEQLKSNFTV